MADGGKFAPVLDDPLQMIVNVNWGGGPGIVITIEADNSLSPLISFDADSKGDVYLCQRDDLGGGESDNRAIDYTYFVNMKSFKPGTSQVNVDVGIGPDFVAARWTTFGPVFEGGFDQSVPFQGRQWTVGGNDHIVNDGSVVGQLVEWSVTWLRDDLGNHGWMAETQFPGDPGAPETPDEMISIIEAAIAANNPGAFFPFQPVVPPGGWGSGTVREASGAVDTRIHFEIFSGPLMTGPPNQTIPGSNGTVNFTPPGGGEPLEEFFWPRARGSTKKNPIAQQMHTVAKSQVTDHLKTEDEVLKDTVLTHANPIDAAAEGAGVRPWDPDPFFEGEGAPFFEEQWVANHGFNSLVIPKDWNQRDDAQPDAHPPIVGDLKGGSTMDGWFAYWLANVSPDGSPDPNDSWEIDSPDA